PQYSSSPGGAETREARRVPARTEVPTMSHTQTEFEQLMERVRAGSTEALDQVCRVYTDHIRRVVRRRLLQRYRSQYDSVDFTQAVWASCMAIPHELYTFQSSEDLVRYLARLATNKVIDAYRRDHGPKHDVQREKRLDPDEPVPARQPTASQLAMADERL